MSLKQFRVVDPILSQYARGYRQRELVASALFPIAFVDQYGGKVLTFGKEHFRLYNTARAPGASTARIQLGYAGEDYSIIPHDLEAVVPRERAADAAAVPGIDLAQRSVRVTLSAMWLSHEHAAASLATNAANYASTNKITLTGTDRWTDPTSDPITDIENAKDAIAVSTGMDPNTMVLSRSSASALRRHPKVVGKLPSNVTQIVSVAQLAEILEIRNLRVASAIYATGADDTLTQVWGDDAVLAYVAEGDGDASGVGQEEPSYGQTYAIRNHPIVEEPYYDNNTKSWVYGVAFHQRPVMCGPLAGYLFKGAGGPPA